VRLVARAEHQRDDILPGALAQFLEFRRVPAQFRGVAAAEFRPARRVVAEPLPELGAGGEVLYPERDVGVGFAQPARP